MCESPLLDIGSSFAVDAVDRLHMLVNLGECLGPCTVRLPCSKEVVTAMPLYVGDMLEAEACC